MTMNESRITVDRIEDSLLSLEKLASYEKGPAATRSFENRLGVLKKRYANEVSAQVKENKERGSRGIYAGGCYEDFLELLGFQPYIDMLHAQANHDLDTYFNRTEKKSKEKSKKELLKSEHAAELKGCRKNSVHYTVQSWHDEVASIVSGLNSQVFTERQVEDFLFKANKSLKDISPGFIHAKTETFIVNYLIGNVNTGSYSLPSFFGTLKNVFSVDVTDLFTRNIDLLKDWQRNLFLKKDYRTLHKLYEITNISLKGVDTSLVDHVVAYAIEYSLYQGFPEKDLYNLRDYLLPCTEYSPLEKEQTTWMRRAFEMKSDLRNNYKVSFVKLFTDMFGPAKGIEDKLIEYFTGTWIDPKDAKIMLESMKKDDLPDISYEGLYAYFKHITL